MPPARWCQVQQPALRATARAIHDPGQLPARAGKRRRVPSQRAGIGASLLCWAVFVFAAQVIDPVSVELSVSGAKPAVSREDWHNLCVLP